MKKLPLDFDEHGRLVFDKPRLTAAGLDLSSVPEMYAVEDGAALIIDTVRDESCRLFAGTLDVLDPGDAVGLVNNLKKSGVLTIYSGDVRKVFYFTRGELVYATSSLPDDRLGNTLWRAGMITLEALNEVTGQVGQGGARLGELLMKHGRLKPRDIYVGLTLQVKEIFLSIFSMSGGVFAFVEKDHSERNAVRLHESTLELTMQGLRQHGELSRLRTLVPDKKTTFVRRHPPPGVALQPREEAVLGLADGGKSFGEILDESHLGEFEGLKTLIRLIRMGVLAPIEAGRAGIGAYERKVDILLEALRLCYVELEAKGPMGALHLESYIEDAPSYSELLQGLTFDADGMFDGKALVSRAVTLYGDKAGETLVDALDELTQYATFEVKNALKPEDAKKVIEAVLHALEQVRDEYAR